MPFATCVATDLERRRPLAVDALVPDALFSATHAITIDATPEQVWPWIAQMGGGRAGWYSWDAIDNDGRPSARHIVPELQAISPGDVMPAVPGATDAFIVASVDPPRELVLTVPDPQGGNVVAWEHLLERADGGRTRLVVRGRAAFRWLDLARATPPANHHRLFIERAYGMLARLPRPLVVRFAALGHRFMEARHLRGIQRRVRRDPFTTADGKARYLSAYDDALKTWPVPFEELEVPTRFGRTYVIRCGPKDAPPLVLLHGYMATSVMWAPNIADLSRRYRVHAIDTMGQPGKSVPDEPIGSAADYVAWLTATLDALHLNRVNLLGMSFGGLLALHYASAAPERVQRLALLSPGGLLPLSTQLKLRAMLMVLLPTRFTVNSLMRWIGLRDDRETEDWRVMELMYLGIKHFRMPTETLRIPPAPLLDEELRGLRMPVLLLIGENEVVYDAASAMARARRLIPDLEGELVPGCRHDMVSSQFQIVDARVLDFLAKPHPQSNVVRRTEALCASPSRS